MSFYSIYIWKVWLHTDCEVLFVIPHPLRHTYYSALLPCPLHCHRKRILSQKWKGNSSQSHSLGISSVEYRTSRHRISPLPQHWLCGAEGQCGVIIRAWKWQTSHMNANVTSTTHCYVTLGKDLLPLVPQFLLLQNSGSSSTQFTKLF
jgi:hypothetical protein